VWKLFSWLALVAPWAVVGLAAVTRPGGEALPGWVVGLRDGLRVDGGVTPGSWPFAAVVAAAVAAVASGAWPTLRYAVTLFHEMGHAYAAGALGGTPARITIAGDSGGQATWGRTSRWRTAVAAAAGYPAAGWWGASGVAAAGWGAGWVWLVAVGATVAITTVGMAANGRAVAVGVAVGTVVAGVGWWWPGLANWVAAGLGAGLCAGGVRAAGELAAKRDLTGSDAGQLRRLCWVPARVTAVGFVAVSAAWAAAGVAVASLAGG
jgi:hypothetical protein